MSIKSTVIENEIISINGQPYDAFKIVIKDDEEFEVEYFFTHAFDHESAHEAIFSGDASEGRDEPNTI